MPVTASQATYFHEPGMVERLFAGQPLARIYDKQARHEGLSRGGNLNLWRPRPLAGLDRLEHLEVVPVPQPKGGISNTRLIMRTRNEIGTPC